ncbi:MAG: sulfatase [Candidatus Sulfomarinibacteraceae bacterium]
MTIRRFSLAILVLAALIVGLADLVHRGSGPSPTGAVSGLAPDHTFIGEPQRSDRTIPCSVAASSETPDFRVGEPSLCRLESGWSQPRIWGSLAMGSASTFEIDLQESRRRRLVIRLRPDPELPESKRQSVKVFVNDRFLDERRVPNRWTSLRIPVPKEALRVGANSFTLVFRHGTSSRLAGTGKGHRRRAARVSALRLENLGPGNDAPPAPKRPVDLWNDERQSLVLESAGTLVLPIYLPAETAEVRFDLRSTMGAGSPEVTTIVGLEELDGASTHRTEFRFSAGRSYAAVRVPTDSRHGRWALLTVRSDLASGSIEVTRIRFEDSPSRIAPRPAEPPPVDPIAARPDIVLITLDAARADRFSFAGHHRETTPFIDALADESLVFPAAYSLVPYTLCSVPTMITGLSFLDHGVTRHEDVLHADAQTLAEALRDAGYQTAAFTATPNNSRAKGFDQGYEVFREMWTEGEKGRTRRASFIANQVVEWLDSESRDERPLHLQVHMVPPHAPYDPPPSVDIFTDPGYDGSCDGFPRTLDKLDSGFVDPEEGCIDHLFALYDGNLHAADRAVRTIIEALRDRPRWDNTVVLITSDHGEAFLEHGRMEHNSTLYSEMLHVPFVLRMPPAYDSTDVRTDRLVTLADIKPTLLGAAGLATGSSMDSVDLLAPAGGPDTRFMVSRTATNPTLLGIRTARWNLIVTAAGSAALFDLEADPGEHHDVRLRNRARYAGLGRILAARIALPPSLEVAAQTADITDDERELLEALGYVRD